MRIIHVTETLVAGVLAAVAALASKQSELGHDVTVVYSRKPAVPPTDELDLRFPHGVHRIEVPYRGRARAVFDLGRTLVGLTGSPVDVVHLHSTFAGVAGRIDPRVRRRVPVIAYSPHGWAFLRGTSSSLANRAALAVERLLARRCDGLILVSESEATVTRTSLPSSTCLVLTNGIPVDQLPMATGGTAARPVVITTGRIMEQKAPDRFADVARVLGDRAHFVWVGDGSAEERERWLGDAPVEVTGWVPHHEVITRLANADVFLFPTRWEGMPIALMEAQAIGLPSVATDIVGNRDVVLAGETGMLCADTPALVAAVTELVDDPQTRERMRITSLDRQRSRLSDASLGERSIAVYGELGSAPAGISV